MRNVAERGDAPDRVADLGRGAVVGLQARAAVGRVLAGWSCGSTGAEPLALNAVSELRRRGAAEGASPALRLDAMAALLALADAELEHEEHPGNVRESALNAAAMVATVSRLELRRRVEGVRVGTAGARAAYDSGARLAYGAACYVLSALVPDEAEWAWYQEEGAGVRGWAVPVLPRLEGPLEPVEGRGPREALRAHRESLCAEHDALMRQMVEVERTRCHYLRVSPTPRPETAHPELLGNVLASVARDSDLLAGRVADAHVGSGSGGPEGPASEGGLEGGAERPDFTLADDGETLLIGGKVADGFKGGRGSQTLRADRKEAQMLLAAMKAEPVKAFSKSVRKRANAYARAKTGWSVRQADDGVVSLVPPGTALP